MNKNTIKCKQKSRKNECIITFKNSGSTASIVMLRNQKQISGGFLNGVLMVDASLQFDFI